MYTITLPTFEGPLDLLLRLIERAELDITTIALAQVADQYLVYVRALEAPDPRALAEFVALAARLLLIKSHALLPGSAEEQPARVVSAERDARALVRQLREYRRYKAVALWLARWQQAGRQMFVRTLARPIKIEPHYPPLTHTLDELVAAARCRRPAPPPPEPVAALKLAPRLTVAAASQRISEQVAAERWLPFATLLTLVQTRQEVVVMFWALLELLKQRQLVAEQTSLFGAILLQRRVGGAVPSLLPDQPASAADAGYDAVETA